MSVLLDFFENNDHINPEFRRHCTLMKELDEKANKVINELQVLKTEIYKKHIYEDEKARSETMRQILDLGEKHKALTEEKQELVVKLFKMQENFIRRLDQKITQTEEDKIFQEQCNLEPELDENDMPNFIAGRGGVNGKQIKQKNQQRGAGGQYVSGKGGFDPFSSSQGVEFIPTKKGRKLEVIDYGVEPFTKKGKKDKQGRKKGGFEEIGFNSRRQLQEFDQPIPPSQDFKIGDMMEEEEDEKCGKCNAKLLIGRNGQVLNEGSEWVQCDKCEKWYHQLCVGIYGQELPEYFYCYNCK